MCTCYKKLHKNKSHQKTRKIYTIIINKIKNTQKIIISICDYFFRSFWKNVTIFIVDLNFYCIWPSFYFESVICCSEYIWDFYPRSYFVRLIFHWFVTKFKVYCGLYNVESDIFLSLQIIFQCAINNFPLSSYFLNHPFIFHIFISEINSPQ